MYDLIFMRKEIQKELKAREKRLKFFKAESAKYKKIDPDVSDSHKQQAEFEEQLIDITGLQLKAFDPKDLRPTT
jgi:hypothetical protein